MPSRAPADSKLPDALYKAMQGVMDTLFAQTDEDGRDISEVFHDLISKRSLPDYYKVIKHPQAMNPVQNAIKKKNYATFSAFVRDCAQIFYNAKYYNISGSQIYEDAVTMEGVLESELRKLKNQGIITEEETKLPDFGPIPPPSDAGSQGSPEPEDDSVGEEEDEEDEEEDNKRRSRRRRTTKREATIDDDDDIGRKDSDQRRKRGRPPRVDTPMECRIKNIMKGLRKCKDENGNLRVNAFEKLPDAKQYPDYYQEIKTPIALDNIRKRIKRREYKSVEQFEIDVRLMCDNAKLYNDDGSPIFNDAVALLEELANLAEAEKARDDSEFQGGGVDLRSGQGKDKQMRIPLKSIDHNGDTYVIGDWIHIANPNDLSKPTVAQIYRTWEDPEGRKWINACWYYRPEQTVHRHDRKFYEHEVVKTGQYRDHQIEEVVGKCFVMFFTRYSRGRPKGIGHRQVYVCESRYNEVEKHFNKIKTWKSCIPDEVRSQDYEIDPFDKQEPLRKFPSPIAHLLPPNATEDDPLPDAKMGAENAPPIVGAVYKRRKGVDSPPPEPTPPPQSTVPAHQTATPVKSTPAPTGTPSTDYHENLSMTQMYKQAHLAASLTPAPQQSPQTPVPATPNSQMHHRPPPPQHLMQTSMAPQYSQQGHNTPMRQGSVHQQYPPAPIPHSPSPHIYQQHHHVIPQSHPQSHPPPQMYPNQPYAHQTPMQPQAIHHPIPQYPGVYGTSQVQHPQYAPPPTAHMHQYPQQYAPHHLQQPPPQIQYAPQMTHQHRAPTQTPMPQPPPSAYYPPPQLPPSTFTLPESTTSGIPESIAEQFLRDEEGRILWFTVPPLETPAAAAAAHAAAAAVNSAKVGPSHSLEYLARRHELLAKKRKRREEREKELRQAKRQREGEKKTELRSMKGALGNALKALGKQLKV